MHSDHDVFVQAIQNKKKVQLAFFADQQGYTSRLCIPLGYKPETEEAEAQYCFWCQQDGTPESPFSLSVSEIAVMQLTEDGYDPAELPPLETKEFSWLLQNRQKGIARSARQDCRKQ